MLLFFFSSRRRHTRCSRDWSSDVCSSDLLRMALGAQRRDVLKLVFGEAAMMVFAGLPIGLIAAGLLTELIKSLLFGISTTDPVTFAAGAVFVSAGGVAAGVLAARGGGVRGSGRGGSTAAQ